MRKVNTWTTGQRTTLHLLHTRLELTPTERKNIFNSVYADELRSCGLPSGLEIRALDAQYSERYTTPRWAGICDNVSAEEERRRQEEVEYLLDLSQSMKGLPTSPNSSTIIALPTPPSSARASSATHRGTRRLEKTWASYGDINEVADDMDWSPSHNVKRARAFRPTKATASPVPQRRSNAVVQYRQPIGRTIMLTQREHDMTVLARQRYVNEDGIERLDILAHPNLGDLLFRYFDENKMSVLNEDGCFVSILNQRVNLDPSNPPRIDQRFLESVLQHTDRQTWPSPFVSTSNSFPWLLRVALKAAKAGATAGRISVIQTSALDHRAVYHIQPLKAYLKAQRPHTQGAGRYPAVHEFVVWGKIPATAIFKTFAVQELIDLVYRINATPILNFGKLAMAGDYKTKIMSTLRAGNVWLNNSTTKAIAQVAAFMLGGTAHPTEHVAHLVGDIIQGLAIHISANSHLGWRALASEFTDNFLPHDDRRSQMTTNLQLGFLEGVKWGLGDFNARHDPRLMQQMLRAAERVGLSSPAEIIAEDLDETKRQVMLYEKRQQHLYTGEPVAYGPPRKRL